MKSRQLKTQTDYLAFAKDFLREFREQYKCSEDYYPRHHHPHITLAKAKTLIETKNTALFKRFFINVSTGSLFFNLMNLYYNDHKQPVQRLACDNAILKLTGHGECGVLAGGMIFRLLKTKDIAKVERIELDGELHALIVIHNANSSIQIAIDPFFDICCPLKDYWTNEKLIRYGRALNSTNWTPTTAKQRIQSYELSELRKHQTSLELQINQLMMYATHPDVKKFTDFCQFASTLSDPFDTRSIHEALRFAFLNDLLKQQINPQLAEMQLNLFLPPLPTEIIIPKKNQTRIDDTSLITYLKGKTPLHFFGVVDDDYHVDAIAPVKTKEDKSAADNLQKGTQQGRFFTNRHNETFFVIEHINTTTNGTNVQKYLFK